MLMRKAIIAGWCVAAMLTAAPVPAFAAGLEAGKDCHVIQTCNFARTASVRGCLSSYSCRQCTFVKRSVVSVDGVRRTEWRSVCEWGAGS